MNIRREFVSLKWWFIVPLIALYLWNDQRSLVLDAKTEELSINFWDLALRGVSDVYLIIYLIFPIYLFKIGHQLTTSFDYTRLIRLGSYRSWILLQMREFARFNLLLLVLWNISTLVIAASLDFSWQWSEYSQFEKSGNEILFAYSQTFSSPLLAFSLQFVLFFLTLALIQLIASIFYCIFQSKRFLNLLLASFMLMAILSFKVLPPSFSFISLPNYLSLFHGIESFNNPITSFVVLFVVFGVMYFSLPLVGKKFTLTITFSKQYGMIGLFIALVGLYIVRKAVEYSDQQRTIIDLLVLTFYGTSIEGFNLLSFSFYIITFLGFVYFIQIHLHEQLTQMSHASIIRYRSLGKWILRMFNVIVLKLIAFLLILLAFTLVLAYLTDYRFEWQSAIFPERSLYISLYHFLVNGFLQMIFYIVVVFAISMATLDVMKSFLALLSMSLFMFPGININYYAPVGLNSMGLLGESQSIFQHSFTLVLFISFTVIFIIFYLRKRDFNL